MGSITTLDKKIIKGQLYKVKKTQTITVTEQNESVNQRVNIHFDIPDKKHSALFGEEWKSEYAPGNNIKKPDILAIYFDDKEDVSQKVVSYILDMKKEVGGDEVITHLIEQWQDGYKHCNTITQYYENVKINFGVICDHFDRERIHNSVLAKRKELEELDSYGKTLMAYKVGQIQQKNRKMIKILNDFLENKFAMGQFDVLEEFVVYMTTYNKDDAVYEFSISLPE